MRFKFLLAPLFIFSLSISLPSCKPSTVENAKGNATIEVRGNCEMCKERIEEVALGLPGIKTASWSPETKQLILDIDTTQTKMKTVHQKLALAAWHSTGRSNRCCQ